ncbi:MAG: hypothetical protein AB7L17_20395 [Ilumatobacteraceae bacterium]
MNPFNTTSLNIEIARDRRRTYEQAATSRRFLRRAGRKAEPTPPTISRPPDRTFMRAA